MANISVYDPLVTNLSKLLNGFFWHPSLLNDNDSLACKLDVAEDDKQYTVHADLPGVSKDDIHVDIEGNRVSISAEVKRQKEEKDKDNVVLAERYEGKVFRSFTLACDVDEAATEATYVDGVLTLTLPKKAQGSTRRIAVK